MEAGNRIGKYELKRKLGNGSFGEVWFANDTYINQECALKILPSSFKDIAEKINEARTANKVNHINLLEVYAADILPTKEPDVAVVVIAQKFYSNGTIESQLNSHNFLPTPLLLKVLKDVLLGLEYLHNGGIIHNDIKPANILLDELSNGVLSDYGISGISITGDPVNAKAAYIAHQAPESKIDNKIDFQTDLFQMGCTAYRLANGISDYSFSQFQPFVPSKIISIIKKALNADTTKRYKTALEMRRDLEKCSFPGYWTIDTNNEFVGKGSKYDYKFNVIPKSGELYDFNAFKINQTTGNKTNVTNFCKKNLKEKDLEKIKKDFFEWVINNAK